MAIKLKLELEQEQRLQEIAENHGLSLEGFLLTVVRYIMSNYGNAVHLTCVCLTIRVEAFRQIFDKC